MTPEELDFALFCEFMRERHPDADEDTIRADWDTGFRDWEFMEWQERRQ